VVTGIARRHEPWNKVTCHNLTIERIGIFTCSQPFTALVEHLMWLRASPVDTSLGIKSHVTILP
jgi:hypothetical protein